MGSFQFSPARFEEILQKRMDPAVQHFSDNATRFARLSAHKAADFVGPDPESLGQDAAKAWDACVQDLVNGRKQMVDLLREFRDTLYEVLHDYQAADGKNAQNFQAIADR